MTKKINMSKFETKSGTRRLVKSAIQKVKKWDIKQDKQFEKKKKI